VKTITVRSARMPTAIQQRAQRAHIIGAGRDVEALVAPERSSTGPGMVAEAARVDLQHQPVIKAHPRHLGQHLAAEGVGLLRRAGAAQRLSNSAAPRPGQVLGPGGGVAVIGGGAPKVLEERPARAVRGEIAAPGRRVLARSARPAARHSPAKPANSGSTTGSGR
jgi:hypothetical protein